LVTVREVAVVVDEKTVVRLKVLPIEEVRERTRGSHAVEIPPRLPSAAMVAHSVREGGRKTRFFLGERRDSFVS
jgi:hypothetical protein